MNRRQFAGRLVTGAAVALLSTITLPLGGCGAVTDLENWIPVALTSVSAIVKLLGPIVPAPVAATIVLIQAGFSALLTALQNYQAGTTVIGSVSNAITAVESAFASFFQSLSVPASMLNLIEGLAGILLSTLSAFAAQISPTPAPTPPVTVGAKAVSYVPKKRSVKQYKSDWDSMCVMNGHPEAKI